MLQIVRISGELGSIVAPRALVADADFKCFVSCYGIGAVDASFRSLQSALNTVAASAGFRPLTVDGKIGASTVAAVKAVAALAARVSAKSAAHLAALRGPLAVLQAATSTLEVSRRAELLPGAIRAATAVASNAPAETATPAPATPSSAPVPRADPHDLSKLPPQATPPPNVEKTVVQREVVERVGGERLLYAGGAVLGLLTVSGIATWAALRSRARRA